MMRCGANWIASQAHGLLSGRLAIAGADSGFDWLQQVFVGADTSGTAYRECEALKQGLAAEPLADIIKDMLQITRATVDDGSDDETTESAYTELVEYLRVAAQLTYEELAEFRQAGGSADGSDALH